MYFPDTQPGDSGIMREGTARCHAVLAAVSDSTLSGSDLTSTGMLKFETDTTNWKICTDGLNDTWVEIANFSGDLTLDGNLTISAGNTLLLDDAIDQIDNLATDDPLNVFLHGAARHELTGSTGAWVSAVDPLKYLIQQLITVSSGTTANLDLLGGDGYPAFLDATDNDINALAVDFTGRTADSVVIVAAHILVKDSSGGSGQTGTKFRIQLDDNTAPNQVGLEAVTFAQGETSGLDIDASAFILASPLTLSAAAHVLNLQAEALQTPQQMLASRLFLLDLGDE
jgi:hypothetical protein